MSIPSSLPKNKSNAITPQVTPVHIPLDLPVTLLPLSFTSSLQETKSQLEPKRYKRLPLLFPPSLPPSLPTSSHKPYSASPPRLKAGQTNRAAQTQQSVHLKQDPLYRASVDLLGRGLRRAGRGNSRSILRKNGGTGGREGGREGGLRK